MYLQDAYTKHKLLAPALLYKYGTSEDGQE